MDAPFDCIRNTSLKKTVTMPPIEMTNSEETERSFPFLEGETFDCILQPAPFEDSAMISRMLSPRREEVG